MSGVNVAQCGQWTPRMRRFHMSSRRIGRSGPHHARRSCRGRKKRRCLTSPEWRSRPSPRRQGSGPVGSMEFDGRCRYIGQMCVSKFQGVAEIEALRAGFDPAGVSTAGFCRTPHLRSLDEKAKQRSDGRSRLVGQSDADIRVEMERRLHTRLEQVNRARAAAACNPATSPWITD